MIGESVPIAMLIDSGPALKPFAVATQPGSETVADRQLATRAPHTRLPAMRSRNGFPQVVADGSGDGMSRHRGARQRSRPERDTRQRLPLVAPVPNLRPPTSTRRRP